MNQFFLIIADYIKGKSIYAPVRRILNFLFNSSIASFIYEKLYGNYEWYNINDYKVILSFFVKGYFFIPFSIYLIVYGFTYIFSLVLFHLLTHYKSLRLTREIIQYEVSTEVVQKGITKISEVSRHVTAVEISEAHIKDLYEEYRKDIKKEDFDKIESELRSPKENLKESFNLCIRGLFAITIYFISIPHFNKILFILVVVLILMSIYILLLAYRFLDILPIVIRKSYSIAETYFERNMIKE